MKSVDIEQHERAPAEAAEDARRGSTRWSPRPWLARARAMLREGWDRFERWLFHLGSRALAVALGIVICAIVANAIVAYVSIQTITDRDAWVAHTQVVLAQISSVRTDLLDAQTGARGYVITGDQSDLRPYALTVTSLNTDLLTLQGLTRDNPMQQARIAILKRDIPVELAELQSWISLRGAGQTSAADARVASGADQQQMNAIRDTLRQMQSTENTLLHDRDASAQQAVHASIISVTLAVLADLAMLSLLYMVLREALRERERVVTASAQNEARARLLALEETNRRMEEFLGVAGHELRTPLTSALANVQIAKRQLARLRDSMANASGEQFGRLLSATERQLRRQARLVDDLLDVTRIESGRLAFRPEEFDLFTLVRRAVEEQQQVWPDRAIALRPLGPQETAPVTADADRIGQVVTNYLTNALKYSPGDAPVEVTVALASGMARVSVRDRGPGLSPEERMLIWERFHRAEGIEVQSGSGVGLGLGLFISKSFIDRHRGAVGVEARAGGGSEFWFTLPLAAAGNAPSLTDEAERADV